MLNKIKLLLGLAGNEKDDLLQLLSDMAVDEVKDYCNIDDISGLENTIIQMVIIKYNLIGHEGLASESYSGASYSYITDYPGNIVTALNKYRRLRVL